MSDGNAELTLRSAVANIAKFVQDVGTLSVKTGYVTIGGESPGDLNFDETRPVAATVIKFDGDCRAIIPMRDGANGPELDRALLELHERNVDKAIEYRARILAALGQFVQGRLR